MLRPFVLALSFALVGVACGGSEPVAERQAASPSPSKASPVGPPEKITLSDGQGANDYGTGEVVSGRITMIMDLNHFEPTIVVGPGGQEIQIEIKNESAYLHDFAIKEQDVDVEVPVGESGVATATIPESGAVTFICNYHDFQFMRGELRAV